MSETSFRTPDQNLQVLLDRYSLSGKNYEPTVDEMSERTSGAVVGPRQGHVFGELTRHGLVHVWADPDKSEYCNAQVLVIDHSFVTTNAHIYNRRKDKWDWTEHTGVTYGVPVIHHEDAMRLIDFNEWTSGKYEDERERAEMHYSRVSRALAQFVSVKGHYDALHQTTAFRNPSVHENLAQLFPYAGEPTGPRVNLHDMLQAGVPLHRSVVEAIGRAPELTIE